MRDIREAFRRSDDPVHEKLSKCFVYNNHDPADCPLAPCKNCDVQHYLDYRPELPETEYAFWLNTYIDAFKPSPEKTSWRDFEIYHAFLIAKNQHERERIKKNGSSD